MTTEEFDKLIGKVVRLNRRFDFDVTVLVMERFSGRSKWYYCYDEYTWFMGCRKVTINREDVISAESLPLHEEIIWRIRNNV